MPKRTVRKNIGSSSKRKGRPRKTPPPAKDLPKRPTFKSTAGKPTDMTHELADEICKLLVRGYFVKTVCDLLGIAYRAQYYEWRKAGKKHAGNLEHPLGYFYVKTNQAQAVAQTKMVDRIMKQDDFRAIIWVLERRYPDTWGQRGKQETNLAKEKAKATRHSNQLNKKQSQTKTIERQEGEYCPEATPGRDGVGICGNYHTALDPAIYPGSKIPLIVKGICSVCGEVADD